MPKTIEQRWKEVGVEREEVARALYESENVYAWDEAESLGIRRDGYRVMADALLPLIEKAVREGRHDEVSKAWRMWEGHLGLAQGSALETYFNGRIRKLESGND